MSPGQLYQPCSHRCTLSQELGSPLCYATFFALSVAYSSYHVLCHPTESPKALVSYVPAQADRCSHLGPSIPNTGLWAFEPLSLPRGRTHRRLHCSSEAKYLRGTVIALVSAVTNGHRSLKPPLTHPNHSLVEEKSPDLHLTCPEWHTDYQSRSTSQHRSSHFYLPFL